MIDLALWTTQEMEAWPGDGRHCAGKLQCSNPPVVRVTRRGRTMEGDTFEITLGLCAECSPE